MLRTSPSGFSLSNDAFLFGAHSAEAGQEFPPEGGPPPRHSAQVERMMLP
jgi:hypothetical protein